MLEINPPPEDRPQPNLDPSYDVIVIGGGPAGSTVGALLAEYGHRTLILERSAFPRFHVGESLVPETYWTFRRLGVLDRLRESAFPQKYSVQFVSDGDKESAPFYFDDYKPGESSVTWQVVRGEFDRMLLDNATLKGGIVRTDAQVLDVLFEGEQAVGVTVQFRSKPTDGNPWDSTEMRETRKIAAKVIVDATGQSAFLASRLGLKQPDVRLKKASVWTYFRDALRDAGKDEGATLIMQTKGKTSWFWYIPLPDDIVSVGVTGGMGYMFGENRRSPEAVFERELKRCPAMQQRLQNAARYTDFFTTKDFSYRASKAAGPGWVLVGDAFGFIDPVYSTGVFLALKSGEFAADAIHHALMQNDVSAPRLGVWQADYVQGVELFRKLVYAFYTPEFSFAQFLRERPRFRNNLIDMLMGNVFQPGVGEMFEQMGEVLPPVD